MFFKKLPILLELGLFEFINSDLNKNKDRLFWTEEKTAVVNLARINKDLTDTEKTGLNY